LPESQKRATLMWTCLVYRSRRWSTDYV